MHLCKCPKVEDASEFLKVDSSQKDLLRIVGSDFSRLIVHEENAVKAIDATFFSQARKLGLT